MTSHANNIDEKLNLSHLQELNKNKNQ